MIVEFSYADLTNVGCLPSNRAEAQARRLPFYFNGQRCPNGHVEPRYTMTRRCVFCTVDEDADWRRRHYGY